MIILRSPHTTIQILTILTRASNDLVIKPTLELPITLLHCLKISSFLSSCSPLNVSERHHNRSNLVGHRHKPYSQKEQLRYNGDDRNNTIKASLWFLLAKYMLFIFINCRFEKID